MGISISLGNNQRIYLLIQWHHHGERADSETGNKPTAQNVIFILCACLDDDSDNKDDTGDNGGHASPKGIGKVTVNEGANPSTKLENRCEKTLLDTSRRSKAVCWIDERMHDQDLREHTLVVWT